MTFDLPLAGELDAGPLFAPARKKRPPKPRMQSTYRDRFLRSRIPAWASRLELRAIKNRAKRITIETGVQHSEDHIVPLSNPMVCGLHCPENLRIVPLDQNMRKSNSWWPDMWGEQIPLIQEAP